MPRLVINPRQLLLYVSVLLFLWVMVVGPTQDAISKANAQAVSCHKAAATAQQAIDNAQEIPGLEADLMQRIGTILPPKNVTEMTSAAWLEVAQIAREHHLTVIEIQHAEPKSISIAVPQSNVGTANADAAACLAGSTLAAAPTTPPPAAAQAAANANIGVLPMTVKIYGAYVDEIGFIADLAGAHVLMQYASSSFTLPQDDFATGSVTLYLYPPIRIGKDGQPTQSFSDTPNLAAQPSASPSAAPATNVRN